MKKQRRERGRELLAGRTPGKLKVVKHNETDDLYYLELDNKDEDIVCMDCDREFAELFAEAPELLEEALEEVERLNALSVDLALETPCDCTRGVLGYEHKGNCSRRIAFGSVGYRLPTVEEEDQR